MKFMKVGAVAAAALFAITACTGSETGGDKGTIEIWGALPRQGSNKAQTDTVVNAINMAIEEKGGEAGVIGGYTVTFKDGDDSTAATGAWDPDTVIKNANDAVANDAVVGIIGHLNSGAAKLTIPIYCKAGIPIISPANTYPGLTKEGKGEPDEPGKYYPDGCQRNYTRVVAADDLQGRAGALWASQLGATKAYVLDDTELYGKGIADVFATEGPNFGIEILGRDGIEKDASDYKALAEKIKGFAPDLVYFGGITQSNAGQLWRDIRDAMPDVMMMGPDGIFEQSWIDAAGEAAEGTYITFGGIPPEELTGAGETFIASYNEKYPDAVAAAYTAYGYEAATVLLGALERAAATNPADNAALRAAITTEMFATKDFAGVLGTWSFNAEGDTSLTEMSGQIVKDGAFAFETVIKEE